MNCAGCLFDATPAVACDCGSTFCETCYRGHRQDCQATPTVAEQGEFTLRPYQEEAVRSVREQFVAVNSTLLVMPTGTGKTVCFATLARDWPHGRVLIAAHREELIFQAAEKCEAVMGERPEIEMGDMAASGSLYGTPKVLITTVQTMSRERRHSRFNPDDFGLAIVDEAHHATAKTYRAVLDYFGRNARLKVLGVTATPDRADEEALGQVFESVAMAYQIPDAIRDGWLVPIDQQIITVDAIDLSEVGSVAGDLNQGQLAAVMEREEALHRVVSPVIEEAGDRPVLLFTASVAHAEMMTEIINRHRPQQAAFICDKTPRDQRRYEIERFRGGDTQYLCNMGIFTEGFDAPRTAVIAVARPTKSRALYAQMVGRGTRPLPGVVDGLPSDEERCEAILHSGKPSVLVLDFVGNAGRHKLVTAADILGGNESDEVVELAKAATSQASKRGEATDVMAAIAKAKAEVEAAAHKRREQLIARARYTKQSINPFDLFDLTPQREPGWHKGRQPSERMKAALEKFGLPPAEIEAMSFWRAKQMMDTLIARIKANKCSYKQARILRTRGYSADLSFDEASSLLTEIARKENWRSRR